MDYLTQRIPINETLRIFDFSDVATDKILLRMKTTHPELILAIGSKIKINGFGKFKLCADLKTMIKMLSVLPGNPLVTAFRSKRAQDLVKQMKGDDR